MSFTMNVIYIWYNEYLFITVHTDASGIYSFITFKAETEWAPFCK